jgi:hypothetical protein
LFASKLFEGHKDKSIWNIDEKQSIHENKSNPENIVINRNF